MSGWWDAVLRMLAGIALLALNMSVVCFYGVVQSEYDHWDPC